MRKWLLIVLASLMLPTASYADDWRERGHRHGGWDNGNHYGWNNPWQDRHHNHHWPRGNDRVVYIAPPPVYYNPRPAFFGGPQCNRPVVYYPRPTYSYGFSVFAR